MTESRRPVSTSRTVYEGLRDDIASGFYSPGDELLEAEIGQRFQVSRTPVREALVRLDADGVVRRGSHRITVVREVTPQDIAEVLEMRAAIEGYSVLRHGAQIDRGGLQVLADGYAARGSDPAPEVFLYTSDTTLHRLILDALQNGRMVDLVRRQDTQIAQLRARFWRMANTAVDAHIADRRIESANEHWAIVGALLEGEYASAHSMLVDHFERAREDLTWLLALISIRGADPASPGAPGSARPAGGAREAHDAAERRAAPGVLDPSPDPPVGT